MAISPMTNASWDGDKYSVSYEFGYPTATTTTNSQGTTMPVSSPFTTTTIETIDGHCGQVKVNGRIVWQGKPRKKIEKAALDAARHLDKRLAAVLA